MENSYGVGVVNRYALFLDDESDPLDVLKAKELEKERKKKTKEAEKENKGKPEAKAKPAVPAPVRKGIKETQNVKPQDGKVAEPKRENKVPARPADPRNPERPPPRRREDRPNGPSENSEGNPRPPRRDFGDRKPGTFEPRRNFGENTGERRNYGGEGGGERRSYGDGGERRSYGDGGERRNYAGGDGGVERRTYGGDNSEGGERRGPVRERGPRDGPRGGGRGQFDGRGKREFDRRSGSDRTGVKPVDKRDGGGSHNWGSHKDDLEEWNKPTPNSEGEQTDGEKTEPAPAAAEPREVVPGAEGTEEVPAGPAAPAVPAEEEAKELTLDEWKALRSGRQKPQYNLRKAGEGEDLTQWKNMVVLKKEKADGEDSDDEYDSAEYPQRVGRQKKVVGIEFTFYEPRRGGGMGRGGRGGRGRGGPGGGRGGGGGGRGERRDEPREGPPAQVGGEERREQRGQRQFAPKVDDNKDFPSLG